MSAIDDTKALAKGALQGLVSKAVALAPDSWVPGGVPDPLIRSQHGHVGKPVSRIDGPLKVMGAAKFAAEFPTDGLVYAAIAYSTIAKGRIREIDTRDAEATAGAVLAALDRLPNYRQNFEKRGTSRDAMIETVARLAHTALTGQPLG